MFLNEYLKRTKHFVILITIVTLTNWLFGNHLFQGKLIRAVTHCGSSCWEDQQ